MFYDNIEAKTGDELYMLEALKEAEKAAELGEVPVGAVIVKDNEIIARAYNQVEMNKDATAHAEMIAIDTAEKILKSKWLLDATMYVTLEPCSMCAGAMILSRIKRLVIGTMDPKTGACGSKLNVAGSDEFNHHIEITKGVLEEECSKILKKFFKDKR